jgi:hypothetical protein
LDLNLDLRALLTDSVKFTCLLLTWLPRDMRCCCCVATLCCWQALPNAHIIHQAQDARDYALRNLKPRSRQTRGATERFFVQLLTGEG